VSSETIQWILNNDVPQTEHDFTIILVILIMCSAIQWTPIKTGIYLYDQDIKNYCMHDCENDQISNQYCPMMIMYGKDTEN
jgi:hypothetical protein